MRRVGGRGFVRLRRPGDDERGNGEKRSNEVKENERSAWTAAKRSQIERTNLLHLINRIVHFARNDRTRPFHLLHSPSLDDRNFCSSVVIFDNVSSGREGFLKTERKAEYESAIFIFLGDGVDRERKRSAGR